MAFRFHAGENGGAPLKIWCEGVLVEDKALEQLKNVARLPFVFGHIAAMSDVHWGMGATVGSVIATQGAIVPAAVGVDIGCGMCAWRLSLKASALPDNLHAVRSGIEAAVPHGRTDNGGPNDRGAWSDLSPRNAARWTLLQEGYDRIVEKHPKARGLNSAKHLGSLGTGNHFIELCLDEEDHV